MKLQRIYPPYEGRDPYLFLCFSDADASAVEPLLKRLCGRGCRVWYSIGRSADVNVLAHRQERANGAALTVLYLSDRARSDTDVKSAVLLAQSRGCPIICLDTDREDSGLSMGLTEQARHIPAWRLPSAEAVETELIRTEGFSQELIGEECIDPGISYKKRLIRRLVTATLLLALAGGLSGHFLGWFAPRPADTVSFTDPALEAAARRAVGGGALTEESLAAVTTLRLDAFPEKSDELTEFPSLMRLEIPQSAAAQAVPLLDDAGYRIVLYGGPTP